MTKRKSLFAVFAFAMVLCVAIMLGVCETNVAKAEELIPVTNIELDGITRDMLPQIDRNITPLSTLEKEGSAHITVNEGVTLYTLRWMAFNTNSSDVGDKFLSGYTYGVRITFDVESGYKRGFDETSTYSIKGIDPSLYTTRTDVRGGTLVGVDFMFATLGNDELAFVDESQLTIPEGYVTGEVNSGYIYLKGGKYPYTFDDITTPNWIEYKWDSSNGRQLNILFFGDRPGTPEGAQSFSFRVTDADGNSKVFKGTIGATVENPNMIKEINIDYTIPSVGDTRPTRAQLHEIIELPDGITWDVNADNSGVNDYGGSAMWTGTPSNFTTFEKNGTYTLKLRLKITDDKVFAGESLLKGTLTSGDKTYTAKFGSVGTKSAVFSVTVYDFGVDPDKIKIVTDILPRGKIGIPYTAKIDGGCGELETFTADTNKTGLTFSTDGTLSGIPTKAGTFDLTVRYHYNGQYRETKNFKVIIEDYTKIAVPTANVDLKYDGSKKIGVNESVGYTLEGNTATAVGTYNATAKLAAGYCWSDGTTDDKVITWTIGKGEKAAPSGLAGIKTSIVGASDGKITGVDGMMEYKAESAAEYTRCTGSAINNLKAGKYLVRYKETDNYNASADTIVTIPDGDKITHTVTVTDGIGGGTYEVGATVTIKANAAESGYVFAGWTISGVSVTDTMQAEITFVMPDCDVTAVAGYNAIQYSVIVDGGTSDVTKAIKGATVSITANDAPIGQVFDKWEVVSGGVTIADVTSKNTTFTMRTSDVSVKATYKKVVYNIVVQGGVAIKSNSIVRIATYGEVITIKCNNLASGTVFDKWIATGVAFEDDTSAETTFTMPACDVIIVANTKTVKNYVVSIGDGLGGGNYYVGQTVTITAGEAPEGKEFDKWVVVSGEVTLANANSESTTFVMPDGAVEIKATYKDKTPSGGGEDNPGGDPATDDPSGENPSTESKGLNGGAIAGIVVGSVVVVGIGGFAIFWFAIKKKSFAELIAVVKGLFKKK